MSPRDEQLAEVVASYGDTIVDVVHVREEARTTLLERIDRLWDQRRLEAHRYVIGEGPRTHLTTTSEALSDPEGFAIVRAEAGGFWLDFTASMRGVLRSDGHTRSFAQLIEAGIATPEAGHHCVLLRPGAEAQVDRGRLQFRVRVVPHEAVRARRSMLDKRFCAYVGASAAFGLTLLGLMRSIPPELLALEQAQLHEPTPAYRLAMQLEATPKPTLTAVLTDHVEKLDHNHFGAGVDEPARRGQNGDSQAPRGPKPKPKPRRRAIEPVDIRRGHDELEIAGPSSSAGLLALAGPYVEQFAAASPGAFTTTVDDHELWRDMTRPIEDPPHAYAGGLGLIGSGRGGASLHDGGYRGGDGEGHRYEPRCGPTCRSERELRTYERVLKLHIGEARVDGELEVYAIRKVIRAHQDELVACLATAFAKQKDSVGELTVNFAITPSGAVATAVIDHSTLDDRHVGRCVTRAIERWRFPPLPAGEVVFVVHEFEFGWTYKSRRRE